MTNPSVIKEFKTLALEGNEPWDCRLLETDLENTWWRN